MAFKGYLRGNTATTIKLGPFLDSTDGNSDETALTVTQSEVRLSKNGGDMAQKSETTSLAHDEIGIYDCLINATDTNTYGRLMVAVHESGALSVMDEYMVLPEIVYDSLYPSAAGAPLPIFGVLDWGTAQTSAAGTLVHRSALSLADDMINGATECIYAGTGAGQARVVHDFTGATDTADVSPNWVTTPSGGSYVTFATPPGPTNAAALPGVNVKAISDDTTAADNQEAMLDGTGGVTLTTAITGNITGSLSGSVGSVTGAVGSVTAGVTVTTNNDKTGYRLSATGVDDILDDPITEPAGVFAWGSATLRNIIAYMGARASNRITETATTQTLRNRANSANIATATVSDDGTTTVKGSDT